MGKIFLAAEQKTLMGSNSFNFWFSRKIIETKEDLPVHLSMFIRRCNKTSFVYVPDKRPFSVR